jgi:hypothetical protein
MPPADESTGPLEQLAAAALVAEAEDPTRGVRYLAVATGDPETDDELARINTLTETAWIPQPDAATTSIRGGKRLPDHPDRRTRRLRIRRATRRARTATRPRLLAHQPLTTPILTGSDGLPCGPDRPTRVSRRTRVPAPR